GAQGQQGATGPAGTQGPQGTPGQQGATGPQGPIGLTGATGPAGPIGATGPQGPQGQTGATGAQGPAGQEGPPGNLNPGSPYYIQNGTGLQTSANFNIDGSGTVGGSLSAGSFKIGNMLFDYGTASMGNAFLGFGGNTTMTGKYNVAVG